MAKKLRTRKQIELEIKRLGGTIKSKKARQLAKKYNDIIVKEKVKQSGLCSINPWDPSDRRYLRKKEITLTNFKNKCWRK